MDILSNMIKWEHYSVKCDWISFKCFIKFILYAFLHMRFYKKAMKRLLGFRFLKKETLSINFLFKITHIRNICSFNSFA